MALNENLSSVTFIIFHKTKNDFESQNEQKTQNMKCCALLREVMWKQI